MHLHYSKLQINVAKQYIHSLQLYVYMFKVFAFGFETQFKTISPLISRLINEALLVADHV